MFLIVVGCRTQSSKPKPTKKWPATEVRNEAAKVAPADIRAVIFPQMPTKSGRKTVRVTDPKLVREFWEGLRVAEWPCDPNALPGNRTEEVYLELKNGKQLGPFGFGTEGRRHAFGKRFAAAYNKVSPQIKIPMH